MGTKKSGDTGAGSGRPISLAPLDFRKSVKGLPGVDPSKIQPAPNKAKPPRPVKKRDVQDIDRADSEGMAQPQGLPPKKRAAKKRKK